MGTSTSVEVTRHHPSRRLQLLRSAVRPRIQVPQILLGYRDPLRRETLTSLLRDDGYAVFACGSGIDLVEWIANALLGRRARPRPDLIICDIALPGRRGIDLLADLRAERWTLPFILLAGEQQERLVAAASRFDGVFVFEELFDDDDLRTAAAVLLQQRGVRLPHQRGPRAATSHRPRGLGAPQRHRRERRTSPRVPVDLWAEEIGEVTWSFTRIANIGTGGILLRHNLPPPAKNSRFDLQFLLPESAVPIRVESRVVSVRREHRSFGVGVEFVDLAPEDRARISSFVNRTFLQ